MGFALGGALALLHLALLWMSVRRLGRTSRPGLWLLATGMARVVLIGGAFVAVAKGGLPGLAGCVAGFLLFRLAGVERFALRDGQTPKGGRDAA